MRQPYRESCVYLVSKSDQGGLAMTIHKHLRTAFAFLLLGGSAAMASAQYGQGYSASYHEESDPSAYAAHWGYPAHDGAYKHAPEYGHPPINRDEYKNIYREAYVRGYEKGYGR
jgi:hypothetical protein